MATFTPSKTPKPIKISKFLGVNESAGQTGLQTGEALKQVNFRITKDYKPQKREGHNTFINYNNSKDVQGMWEGHIGGKHVLISCNDGKVWEYNFVTNGSTQIGTLTDAKTSMLYFQSKLLFLNGTDFKEYDGTIFQDVVPHVPTIYIATPPTGGGTMFQLENLLTGRKKQEFQGNGSATTYQLAETNIDADIVTLTINGTPKTENTHFTVNRPLGTINFSAGTIPNGAPANGSLVIPEWTKVKAGNADLIKKNRFGTTFGPGNDTSIFLWGNPLQKNRRAWCYALNAGYWPVTNFTYVGTDEYEITDIKAQNANYQMILKEDRTHYSVAEEITLPDGVKGFHYPVYDLNEQVGNVALNGVQLVGDNAVSIHGGSWHLWSTGAVESHRNENIISQRLETSLNSIDLTTAITFNYKAKNEYWCNVGNIVYIWNYGNNTMYTFDNILATCFIEIGGKVYYGSNGTIEIMEGYDDNGLEIVAQLDTDFNSFGGINLLKSSDAIYVGLLPDSFTSATIYFKTNKVTEWKQIRKTASYVLMDFNNVDFDNFSFNTNRNPQPFPLEFSSNDYVFIQFRIENAELNETCTILDLLVQAEVQGEV